MATRAKKRKVAAETELYCLKCDQPTKAGFLDTGSVNGGPSTKTYVFSSCCLSGLGRRPVSI